MTAIAAEVGSEIPVLATMVTRETLVRYAGASGDFNPIHYSDFHATALGLPGVIGHGMLTMGLALRAVTDWVQDPARVRGAFVRFTRPIPVPDDAIGAELVITGTVTKIAAGIATVALDVRHGSEKVLGMATAEVDIS
ncbi:MaoC family dehydratase [Microlunatus endophyticus]|uniref:MaoC family dehydratase n=1 Tax=Microlunatus endophyticus TaxID=1716077 RepID=A0A917SEN5_9ACTN|nr:MaoC/PaaZ C-terminal domain-containing protein [Microlunatus endophyticus]GGL76970.1 MaoC family dehydratase [Microlunatus endophyticus]